MVTVLGRQVCSRHIKILQVLWLRCDTGLVAGGYLLRKNWDDINKEFEEFEKVVSSCVLSHAGWKVCRWQCNTCLADEGDKRQ